MHNHDISLHKLVKNFLRSRSTNERINDPMILACEIFGLRMF